jgi:hypothetical protein
MAMKQASQTSREYRDRAHDTTMTSTSAHSLAPTLRRSTTAVNQHPMRIQGRRTRVAVHNRKVPPSGNRHAAPNHRKAGPRTRPTSARYARKGAPRERPRGSPSCGASSYGCCRRSQPLLLSDNPSHAIAGPPRACSPPPAATVGSRTRACERRPLRWRAPRRPQVQSDRAVRQRRIPEGEPFVGARHSEPQDSDQRRAATAPTRSRGPSCPRAAASGGASHVELMAARCRKRSA